MEPWRCPAGDACPAAAGGWPGPWRGACRCVRAPQVSGGGGPAGCTVALGKSFEGVLLCLGASVTAAGRSSGGPRRGSRSSALEFQRGMQLPASGLGLLNGKGASGAALCFKNWSSKCCCVCAQ